MKAPSLSQDYYTRSLVKEVIYTLFSIKIAFEHNDEMLKRNTYIIYLIQLGACISSLVILSEETHGCWRWSIGGQQKYYLK